MLKRGCRHQSGSLYFAAAQLGGGNFGELLRLSTFALSHGLVDWCRERPDFCSWLITPGGWLDQL